MVNLKTNSQANSQLGYPLIFDQFYKKIGLFFISVILLSSQGFAQNNYPNKPVKIVIPSPPGGGTDIVGRVLAQHFSQAFSGTFYIENKPGAGNLIGIEYVAQAPSDGYTLLFVPTPLILNPLLYKNVNYDPIKNFDPISLAAITPNILVTSPQSGINNLQELIFATKKDPEKFTYGSAGIGTSPHMTMELFMLMTGTQLRHIPYKGTSAAINDTMSGQISAVFSNAIAVMPLIQAGKLRALATTGKNRLNSLPDIPTVAEKGYPEFEAYQWYGLVAPKGTPENIIKVLHQEMRKALKTKSFSEKLAAEGAEPVGSSPEEFAKLIKSDYQKWALVAKKAGIEPQ